MSEPVHQVYVEVTWELAHRALRGDLYHGGKRNNLPEDAKLLGIYVDDWKHTIRAHYESPSFAPVPEGWELPRFDLEFSR